jgi:hypothetical protein
LWCNYSKSRFDQGFACQGMEIERYVGISKGKDQSAGKADILCNQRGIDRLSKVFEEIGFDCSPYLRENEYLERKIHDQNVRLYMISGIDESEEFITQTRKEIGVFWLIDVRI